MANLKLLLILLVAVAVSLVTSKPVFKRSQVRNFFMERFSTTLCDFFVLTVIGVRFDFSLPLLEKLRERQNKF